MDVDVARVDSCNLLRWNPCHINVCLCIIPVFRRQRRTILCFSRWFHVSQFPTLHFCAANSFLAVSCLAVSAYPTNYSYTKSTFLSCIRWSKLDSHYTLTRRPVVGRCVAGVAGMTVYGFSARQRLLRRSRSFKVTDFSTNRKPVCDFPLMNNARIIISNRFYRAAWNADGQNSHRKTASAFHAARSYDENSVRLSVKRVHCDKTEEKSIQIFTPCELSFILVFWEEEWLVGRPLLPKILDQPAPVVAKSLEAPRPYNT